MPVLSAQPLQAQELPEQDSAHSSATVQHMTRHMHNSTRGSIYLSTSMGCLCCHRQRLA